MIESLVFWVLLAGWAHPAHADAVLDFDANMMILAPEETEELGQLPLDPDLAAVDPAFEWPEYEAPAGVQTAKAR